MKKSSTSGPLSEAASAMGKKGGKRGGVKRAEVLSPERRREIARLGGLAKAKKAQERNKCQ